MAEDNQTPAADVFRIQLVQERIGALRGALRMLWALFVTFSPLYWFRDEGFEPIVKNSVEVVWASDDALAVAYDYRLLSEGKLHQHLLEEKIHSMTASDFAEELGIERR